MATQQEVIKAFMKALDTQTLKKKSNETTIAFTIRIIDEAIKACSNFTDTSSLRAKIISDYESCVAADPKNGWKKFLLEKCGINLDNTDTGAIIGSDVGGSKIKTATNVVPNGSFDNNFKGTSFTKRGVTFPLAYQDNKTIPYPSNSYLPKNCDVLTAEELHVWQGLKSFWAEESLKLIEESYGYKLTDSDSKIKQIRILFVDDSSSSKYTAKAFFRNANKNYVYYVYVAINMYYFRHIDKNNLDGKYPYWDDYYLDRLIAHEFTHVVMDAKVNNFSDLPSIIIEGLAELTPGMDDSQDINIKAAVASKSTLEKLLVFSEDYNKVDGVNNADYVAGYIFLRYLAKQALVQGVDKINTANSKKVTGTELNDTIANNGGAGNNYVLLYADAFNASALTAGGKDSIYSAAQTATINAGAGNDYLMIYTNATKNTVNAGDGNDLIYSGAQVASINAGAGNDYVHLYSQATKTSVRAGAGNDTIQSYSTGVTYFYAAGDGNDCIKGFNGDDTISITGAKYSSVKSGSNVILTVGTGKITLVGAAKLSKLNIKGTLDGGAKNINNATVKTKLKGTKLNDTIYSNATNVTIDAAGGNESISNRNSSTSISGGAGNDSIYNDGSKVTIIGGTGKDSIRNFAANATFIYANGDGNDSITGLKADSTVSITGAKYSSIKSGSNVILTVGTGKITLVGAAKLSKLNIKGTLDGGLKINNTANSKKVTGTDYADTVENYGGKVTISALGGNDSISNRNSSTSISGGAGNDSIYNDGSKVTIIGGTGKDSIRNFATNSKIDGGIDNDIIYNGKSGNNVTIIGGDGNDNIDSRGAIVSVNAGAGNDSIYVEGSKVTIVGGKGNDTLTNTDLGGKATLIGGAGEDYITTYNANNVSINGGDDADTIWLLGTGKFVTVNGGKGNDLIYSYGANLSISGGEGNDRIYNYATSVVTINCNDGNDYIANWGAAALMSGGNGADTIYGDAGNDTLSGGKGDDHLWGDAGKDTFLYSNGDGKDVIHGFDKDDLLQITGTFSPSYNKSKNEIYFKVGSTANAITLKDFGTTTNFHVNSYTYQLQNNTLTKK